MPAHRCVAFGSEFVGEVVAAGPGAAGVRVGDRVVGNYHYTGPGRPREGVPTNQSSRHLQRIPATQLMRVPDSMPDETAAAFALNAQTAYGMIRRAGIEPGARVLVPAGSANLSLFLIAALRHRGVHVYTTTTRPAAAARLARLGVREALVVPRGDGEALRRSLRELAGDVGEFDCVLDAFFDLHLEAAAPLIRPFGSYVTCGLAGQSAELRASMAGQPRMDAHAVLCTALVRNLQLVGNCIGLSSDLEAALADHEAGRLETVIDSVHGDDAPAAFVERSFGDADRFGKVVFRYSN
jgi:NADPH:quinone reductase-like Zn-dependent oxidoreductase